MVGRLRRLCAAAVLAGALVASGCGGSAAPPTSTLADATRVSSERYLADLAAGASAMRAFVDVMEELQRPATAASLKREATRFDPSLVQARLVGQRLSAARLADSRLEGQRERIAPLYADVLTAMERLREAAATGDTDEAQRAVTTLRRTILDLRAAGMATA